MLKFDQDSAARFKGNLLIQEEEQSGADWRPDRGVVVHVIIIHMSTHTCRHSTMLAHTAAAAAAAWRWRWSFSSSSTSSSSGLPPAVCGPELLLLQPQPQPQLHRPHPSALNHTLIHQNEKKRRLVDMGSPCSYGIDTQNRSTKQNKETSPFYVNLKPSAVVLYLFFPTSIAVLIKHMVSSV